MKLDQIKFKWTFLEKIKIEMPNIYFGDDFYPEFIAKRSAKIG